MTDIKDVIHFYLGCDFQIIEDISTRGRNYKKGEIYFLSPFMLYDLDNHGEYHKIKPRLRPLSSMTKEEAMKDGIGSTAFHTYSAIQSTMKMRPGLHTFYADQFLYLLKNSFDLWNLIESNQAIDKTKMK